MIFTTDDVTASTKAMYESSILLPELFDEPVWDKLDNPDRNDLCKAFSAGLAAMPDHSAELLEALEEAERAVSKFLRPESPALAKTRATIAKARAQKGGAHV